MIINKTSQIDIPDNYTFYFTDDPINKKVTISINGSSPSLIFTIYQGDSYDAAGDYTQTKLASDVAAYIQTLV